MKYALLVSRTLGTGSVSGWKNIGDYIQSLAAAQYLPKIDEYFDKTADDNGTDVIKMIMNAWYIWSPEKFPVSKRIIPLPISMHISPVCSEKLLSIQKVLDWFKKNEPIGCRDKDTEQLLKSKGIKSYFSGCLTLTLGKKYKYSGERKGLVFVDPYLAVMRKELSFWNCAEVFFFSLAHIKTLHSVQKRFSHYYCLDNGGSKFHWLIRKLVYSAIFIRTYGKKFSMKQLANAEYITHFVKVGEGTNLQTEKEKMKYAEMLVKKYASAELVVTGRIHCALPCLGVETPVVFTAGHTLEEGSDASSAGRFGGLIDFLNVAHVKKLRVSRGFASPVENKDLFRPYAEELDRKCMEFVKGKANNGGGYISIANSPRSFSEALYA